MYEKDTTLFVFESYLNCRDFEQNQENCHDAQLSYESGFVLAAMVTMAED